MDFLCRLVPIFATRGSIAIIEFFCEKVPIIIWIIVKKSFHDSPNGNSQKAQKISPDVRNRFFYSLQHSHQYFFHIIGILIPIFSALQGNTKF